MSVVGVEEGVADDGDEEDEMETGDEEEEEEEEEEEDGDDDEDGDMLGEDEEEGESRTGVDMFMGVLNGNRGGGTGGGVHLDMFGQEGGSGLFKQ